MSNVSRSGLFLGILALSCLSCLGACSQAPVPVERKEQLHFGRQGAARMLIVSRQQNLADVARDNGVSLAEMAKLNRIAPQSVVEVGQPLKVPYKGESIGSSSDYSGSTSSSGDVSISAEPIPGSGTQSGISSPRAQHIASNQGKIEQESNQVVAGRESKTLEQQLATLGDRPVSKQAGAAQHKALVKDKGAAHDAVESTKNKVVEEYTLTEEVPAELQELKAEENAAATKTVNSAKSTQGGFKLSTPLGDPRFMWPSHGKILSHFKAGSNEGMNIAVNKGSNVLAAADGEVVYVGQDVEEYGRMLIIRHADNIFTAYAHNDKLLVNAKDKVRRGQIVAQAGQSGNVTSPQLYFSVRKNDDTVDPEQVL